MHGMTPDFDHFYDIPAWFEEVGSALAYSDHIVLSGNVGDVYPSADAPRNLFEPLPETLWTLLRAADVGALLSYDPIGGVRIVGAKGVEEQKSLEAAGFARGGTKRTPSELAALQAKLVSFTSFRVALLIDHASRMTNMSQAETEAFFMEVDLTSRRRRHSESGGINPTFWLVDHPNDMPDWFVLNNAALREIQLERPNLEVRFHFAQYLARKNGWIEDAPNERQDGLLQQFALECDAKPLMAMDAIAKVALVEGLGLDRIGDAVRVFRTGMRRNPWTSPVLRKRMRDAETVLGGRIKGQPYAIEKALDILARAILGLSGAQSGAMHTRPRGALFFVGPTGVGKTELAKSLTELLFGDETLCHRFDMSEFMEESSVSRLIGAPPGHAGHENGGELVNAALRRPFSVFLFDEVEKAHPRILDLFLQILDEGRLTDARGSTAYFSEALIVFTSNVGMTVGSRATNMGMNVLPSDSHEELSLKIHRAVEEHFRIELRRPELLNRIGQNVVVFDFLDGEGMAAIFNAILGRVIGHVAEEHGTEVHLTPEVRHKLQLMCTQDFFDGGRGIANRIETHFINPLARNLFATEAPPRLIVTGLQQVDGKTILEINARDEISLDGRDVLSPTTAEGEPIQRKPQILKTTERWRSRFDRL